MIYQKPSISAIIHITFVIILLLIPNLELNATHNRSGEITYKQIGPLSIEATITTYTKASSTAADRDSLELFWGDGSFEYILRSNGEGEVIPGTDIKKNLYIQVHTYPGQATYTLSFTDPNRVSGILNVNFPNSVDVPFYLETTFTFLNPQFEGENSSAILLQPPIDFACIQQRFIHNPNAFDPDGDSLSYELVEPLQSEGMPVPQYVYPDAIAAGPNNLITLDPVTGDFIWDAPQSAGEYNIAIKINEYRNGNLINSIIRDMQIFVDICEFKPPKISTEDEICVIAGDLIDLELLVTDPDSADLVFLSATGGPFNLEVDSAMLITTNEFQNVPFSARFVWQTNCTHISPYPYQVVFRAQDNSAGNNLGLADLKTIQIRIIGPPAEELEIANEGQDFKISWAKPYMCEALPDDYFLGFSVWRKIGTNPFIIDSCSYGLEGKGYSKVEFITNEFENDRYFFIDENTEAGSLYCYRVLAEFARKTDTGNPFNRVQSLPSEELCKIKSRDFPFLLNASVEETDETQGEMYLRWTRPNAEDLDSMINTGPYNYQLYFSEHEANNFNPVPGASYNTVNFNSSMDSSYFQGDLNTNAIQYDYKVLFKAEGSGFESESPVSSSVYLEVSPTDESNILTWEMKTSWQNYSYSIFRYNEITMDYDSIGESITTQYIDKFLENGRNYCYIIKSYGSYGVDDITSPLINYSQEACGVPVDIKPPCQIPLRVENPCSELTVDENIVNILNWNNARIYCDDAADASFYNVYYSNSPNNSLSLLIIITDIEQISLTHEPTMGSVSCYAISVVDSLGNEGALSDLICVENCPSYELPNTFTPNGDGANDLFRPSRNRFIEEVEFKVYNRWGNLIYETNDPELNWDGKNLSGKDMDEAVYYYTCELFEMQLDGLSRRTEVLEGFIHLIRSN